MYMYIIILCADVERQKENIFTRQLKSLADFFIWDGEQKKNRKIEIPHSGANRKSGKFRAISRLLLFFLKRQEVYIDIYVLMMRKMLTLYVN